MKLICFNISAFFISHYGYMITKSNIILNEISPVLCLALRSREDSSFRISEFRMVLTTSNEMDIRSLTYGRSGVGTVEKRGQLESVYLVPALRFEKCDVQRFSDEQLRK